MAYAATVLGLIIIIAALIWINKQGSNTGRKK